jgi:hypothetical protein
LPATVVNVEVRLVPTALQAVIAATAISAAIRPYSTAVAPSSFFRSLVNVGAQLPPFATIYRETGPEHGEC